jgi:hypothetical protein
MTLQLGLAVLGVMEKIQMVILDSRNLTPSAPHMLVPSCRGVDQVAHKPNRHLSSEKLRLCHGRGSEICMNPSCFGHGIWLVGWGVPTSVLVVVQTRRSDGAQANATYLISTSPLQDLTNFVVPDLNLLHLHTAIDPVSRSTSICVLRQVRALNAGIVNT